MSKKSDNKELQEALTFMSSGKSELFVDELKFAVKDALSKAKGEKNAHVQSAVTLTSTEKQELEKVITTVLGHEVRFMYETNKGLLGGFKVKIGDWKLDGTLVHQLEYLKQVVS